MTVTVPVPVWLLLVFVALFVAWQWAGAMQTRNLRQLYDLMRGDDSLARSDVVQVLARAYDDDIAELMEEWDAWYQPEQWLHIYRALGAFIHQRNECLASRAASPGSTAP